MRDAVAVAASVVVPHFNQPALLPRAVASALASDQGEDIEVIVVDDGSSGESAAVLDRLEAADPRLRVLRSPRNRGAPFALNEGLAAARGRYVSFLGADDLVLPHALGAMRAALDEFPSAAFACGGIAVVAEDGTVLGVRPVAAPSPRRRLLTPDEVRRRIRASDNWVCNTAALYRAENLRAIGGFEPELGAFCDGFAARLLAFSHGFVFVPGLHGAWQAAAGSLSAVSLLDRAERLRLIDRAAARLAASPVARAAPGYPALFTRRLRFAAARMQLTWRGAEADPADIVEIMDGTARDGSMLRAIRRACGFGRAGRALALVWLALRMRPFAVIPLALSALRNRRTFRREAGAVHRHLARCAAAGHALTATDAPAPHGIMR